MGVLIKRTAKSPFCTILKGWMTESVSASCFLRPNAPRGSYYALVFQKQ